MFAELLKALLTSRLALLGTIGGVVGMVAAAAVRLIPWTLALVVLVFAVVGVVAFTVLRQWWARRKDAAFEAGVDAQGQRAVGQSRVRDREAVKALQTQWKEQVETLRRSRIGKQRRWLYFLPWYAIIGAPASGKSTAIEHSGLRFPMGKPKLAGTGGTRNCDWWFAEDAIVLDTAGRYAFNEENEPDRDEWLEFLRLLKRYRPAAPINGLIVAVPADELLGKEAEALVEDARTMRHKLDQLVRELGIQFPVYLLITKCDLIEGFTEFFGRLPRARLDEMVGWTHASWDMGDPRALVAEALRGLRERVEALRPTFLWDEDRPERLRAVYLFPEELAALQERLEAFADVLFRETQYNESPFLRGIYLTSGLQKGTAVSRMLDRLGLGAQATELRDEKRSYFLHDFFQTRLPSDRHLVATTGRAHGHLQAVHNVALAAVAAVCILVGVVASGSYVANRTLLNQLEDEMVAAAGDAPRAPDETMTALGRYVDVIRELEDRDRRRPLSARWGLWQGDRAIDPARRLFLDRFERDGYAPAMRDARRVIATRDLDRGFDGLEAAIRDWALARIVARHDEPPGGNDALASFWAGGRELSDATLSAWSTGYLAYLGWRPEPVARAEEDEDARIVREALPEMFTVDRVAAWADRHYQPVRAQDLRDAAPVAAGASVRGAFRPDAWNERIEPLVDAVDEIAPAVDETLVPRFRAGYRDAWYAAWRQFLFQPSLPAAAQVPASTLLGPTTPYLAVIRRVGEASAFDAGTGERPAWTASVARVAGAGDDYVAQLAPVAAKLRDATASPAVALEDARAVFVKAAPVDGGEPPADPFGKADEWVRATVRHGDPADAGDAAVRTRLVDMLKLPLDRAWRDYLDVAAGEVDRRWAAAVASRPTDDCAQVMQLYGDGGEIPGFVQSVMQAFFEPGGFQPRVRYGAALPRVLGWYPPKRDAVLKRCRGAGGAGGGGSGGGPAKLFFTSVPGGVGENGVFATRTVLTVWCGDEPKVLTHRQYKEEKQLTWSPDTCTRAEVTVYGGTSPDDERLIGTRASASLCDLIKQADERSGPRIGWRFDGGVMARFDVALPPHFCEGTQGLAPPPRLPRG